MTTSFDVRQHFAKLEVKRRHFYVYRAFDSEGRLLYVGSTGYPAARWSNHKRESCWVKYAHRFKVQGPYSEGTARRIESEAIADEKPFFNATGNPWVREAFDAAAKRQHVEAFRRVGIAAWPAWVTSGERIRFNEAWREVNYLEAVS